MTTLLLRSEKVRRVCVPVNSTMMAIEKVPVGLPTGLSRTAHVHMTHLESWSRISRPPPRTRPKIPFPHARTRSAKNFFESVSSRPRSRPDKIIRAIKAEEEKRVRRGPVKKKGVKIVTFHVYGANVTIVGAATRSQLLPSQDPQHASLSSALAAASPPSLCSSPRYPAPRPQAREAQRGCCSVPRRPSLA